MIKTCYGRRHGKLAECAGCDLAQYCLDAADPALSSSMPLDEGRAAEKTELHYDDPPPTSPGGNIVELVEAARANPDLWRVAREKLADGSAPLSVIAARAGLKSKQLAHYRLTMFVRLCPVVFDALTIDRRFVKHRPSKYYSQPPTKRKRQWIATEAYHQQCLPGL